MSAMASYTSNVESFSFCFCKVPISERWNFHHRLRLAWRCAIGDHDYPLRRFGTSNKANGVDFHMPKMAWGGT